MQTNDHVIRDYDAVLDAEFGKPGTPQRIRVYIKRTAILTSLFYKE